MHGALWQFPQPAVAPSISFTKSSSPSKTRYIDSIAAMRFSRVRGFDDEDEYNSDLSRYNSLESDTSKDEFFEEVFAPLYVQLGGIKSTEAIVTSLFNKLQTDSVIGAVFVGQSKNHILREKRAFLQQVMGVPERSHQSYAKSRELTFLLKNEKMGVDVAFQLVKDRLLQVLDEFIVDPALIHRVDMILSIMKTDIISNISQPVY